MYTRQFSSYSMRLHQKVISINDENSETNCFCKLNSSQASRISQVAHFICIFFNLFFFVVFLSHLLSSFFKYVDMVITTH